MFCPPSPQQRALNREDSATFHHGATALHDRAEHDTSGQGLKHEETLALAAVLCSAARGVECLPDELRDALLITANTILVPEHLNHTDSSRARPTTPSQIGANGPVIRLSISVEP